MSELLDIEAIKRLKHHYFRCVDTKRFDEIATLFTDDATSSYNSGEHSYEGKEAIKTFFERVLGTKRIMTQHMGHHPEIDLISDTTATGVWYMEDSVYILDHGIKVRGNGLYWDEYRKVDGQWLISHIGYERIWEYTQKVNYDDFAFKTAWDDSETERRSKRVMREGEIKLVP
jgi:ketosteroid isomerase-like protein